MKKLFIIAAAIVAMGMSANAQSVQEAKELIKERKVLAKQSKSELNQKASKAARREAKKLKKEGWKLNPGALPLEKQLDKSYMMQMEFDENMTPKYIMGEARSIGENYDAAKMQALALAKNNLAGNIQTEVAAIIVNNVDNGQLAQEQAASITETVFSGKQLIMQRIGRTATVVEVYRTLPNKNKEVLVRIAYDSKSAMEAGKKPIRDELKEKGEDLQKQLDQMLGW